MSINISLNTLTGTVIKIHSDFYYVKTSSNLFECKIREKLKKEKTSALVGDSVRIEEINLNNLQAVIVEVLERKNFLPRPSIANIDQVIVVLSLKQPDFDFIQLNRYLTLAKLNNIQAVICLNKSDLQDSEDLKQEIMNIYKPLGYKIVFTSAKTGLGVEELKELLINKISVLSGISGVGKSSLLNIIHPELNLRTKQVAAKTFRGTHTTRHVELLNVPLTNGEIAQIADTPGFSYLRFDNNMPAVIARLFEDIVALSTECFYSNCLHLEENGCNVLKNIENIHPTRFQSYKIFIKEALEHKDRLANSGHKEEDRVKTIDSQDNEKIRIVKLGTQSREKSRKKNKQKINFISIMDEAYYNNDDEIID